ncbi:MAG: TonB-dependent receptor [Microscillaceae bacterium]|nr:TonB-dependent receptor [Microscillaceae bacterium]MDW8461608.1 TonB-dependent receptor [Cytophagales bacterium]
MQKILIFIYFWAIHVVAFAQTLQGIILDKESQKPLVGANIIWKNTQIGTQTNDEGKFYLEYKPNFLPILVVSYTGYQIDSLQIKDFSSPLTIYLKANQTLQTVEIKANQAQNREIANTEILTSKDLKKAACCNLSESFETQTTIDVQTADAVSGTKQVKMLGLDGVYAQIMIENIPTVRGLIAKTGMHYFPGTWIQSIEINKGAGSVANGYESMTGQINVEMVKPQSKEKLLFNFFAGDWGRLEANLNLSQKISEKWQTATLLHASTLAVANDNNKDGFMDLPQYQQLNLINRWKYENEKIETQFGMHVLVDNKTGGQVEYNRTLPRSLQMPYGFLSDDKHLALFAKTGFFLGEKSSLGIITNYAHHQKNAAWGLNDYTGTQNYALMNLIYETETTRKDKLRLGANFMADDYKESYIQNFPNFQSFNLQRNEKNTGLFAEYTWNIHTKFQLLTGLRYDWHNLMGNFLTPRLHAKYEIGQNTFLRLSVGRGQRIANALVESMPFLMSSRSLQIENNLSPERAWNYGMSFSHKGSWNEQPYNFEVSYYRTDFENQIITDLDYSPQTIRIYNLQGKSFANSLQTELKYEPWKNVEIALSYKWYDVRNSFVSTPQINESSQSQVLLAPLVARHRALFNVAYTTPNQRWKADFTTQFWGRKRLPNTKTNPSEHQLADFSPNFFLLNSQITHIWKRWEFYLGAENLLNFMQDMPIIKAQNPFSPHFDAGLIWGPVMGRMLYAGLRFSVMR